MPTIKLTDTSIDKVCKAEKGKQVLWWDTETRGLGVLVSGGTGTKTFVVQHKLTDGRTRRISVGPIAMGLRQARVEAATHVADMLRGNDPKAARREAAKRGKTLRAALDAYLASNKELSARTKTGYRGSIESWLSGWLDTPLRDLTKDVVRDRHADIAAEVSARHDGKRSGGGPTTGEATANSVMRTLRAIYNDAVDADATLPANPVRLRKAWFDVKPRERFLSGDQLPIFFAALEKLENQTQADYIRLLLFTGLRRSSAAALTWDQVDFASRVIRLPSKQMKGGKRPLNLPMTDYVRELLVKRRALGNDGGWVFGADSESGHLGEPKFAFQQVGELTGIAMSAHDMRRTYITHAEESDISVMALKALVNHAIGGDDVTEGYVRMATERLRESAQRVCDRLKSLCKVETLPEGVEKIG